MEYDTSALATFVGAFIAFIFEYIPQTAGWLNKFTPNQKRGIIFVIVALVTVLSIVGKCYNVVDLPFECPAGDFWPQLFTIVYAVIVAVVTSQGVFWIFPKEPEKSGAG